MEKLRVEVQRLLSAALQADADHLDALTKLRQLHVDEVAAGRKEAGDAAEAHAAQVAHLQAAIESRDLIGQAKGVIMAALGCSADDAYALLVKQSQHENRKLHAIAAEIVERSRRPPSD